MTACHCQVPARDPKACTELLAVSKCGAVDDTAFAQW